MGLSMRQARRYRSLASVYRKRSYGTEWYLQILNGVPCAVKPTDNYDFSRPLIGLVKQDNIQTSDSIHFEAGVDLRAEDVIFIEPESLQEPERWYVVVGAPERHVFRGSFLRVYVNGCRPVEVAE